MRLDLLLGSAGGCPGSTCISPAWLEGVIRSLSGAQVSAWRALRDRAGHPGRRGLAKTA